MWFLAGIAMLFMGDIVGEDMADKSDIYTIYLKISIAET